MIDPRRVWTAASCLLIVCVAPAPAQVSTAVVEPSRVRELLDYLASDGLAGRDSPSRGQREAALFLAWTFAHAGLEPAGVGIDTNDADWFQRFALPARSVRTESATLLVTVAGAQRELVPGVEFRLWSASRMFEADDLVLGFESPDDPRGAGQRRAMAGRTARFVAVAPDSTPWREAADGRLLLERRRGGAAPVVLVRDDVARQLDGAPAVLRVAEAPIVDAPLRNVVAMLRGTDLADRYVVVSAHYDHVGVAPTSAADAVFNGADDDASGTTAVVALAEHFARRATRTRRSLLFVCFAAEEKGLLGSAAFVADPPVPLAAITADVNIEMIGRPAEGREPYCWITGRELSDVAEIAAPLFAAAGVELTDHRMASQLFMQSDNWSFARAGVVAHSFSAGELHRDYHQLTDEPDRIDASYVARVIGALAPLVEELANRDAPPAWKPGVLERLRR